MRHVLGCARHRTQDLLAAVGRDDRVALGDPTCRRPSGTARVVERREALGRRRSGEASPRGRGVVSRSAPASSGRARARRRTFMRASTVSLNGLAATTSPHTGMSALPCARIVLRPSIARIPSHHAAERKLAVGIAGARREIGRWLGNRSDETSAVAVLAMACGAVLDEDRAVGVLALPGSAGARRGGEGNRDGDGDSIDAVVVYLLRSFTRLPRAGSARSSNRRPYARRSARGRPPS